MSGEDKVMNIDQLVESFRRSGKTLVDRIRTLALGGKGDLSVLAALMTVMAEGSILMHDRVATLEARIAVLEAKSRSAEDAS